jgi:LCP family protein required for cell wall assembly
VNVAGPSSTRHRRRRSSAPIAGLLALIVGVAGAAGVISAANSRTSDVERIEGLEEVLQAQDGPAVNYLLIGSDTRATADPTSVDFGGIGDANEVSGQRSDTIMIMRQEKDGNGVALLSLPRDLWVNIPGRSSPSRINAAYSDGTDVLAATITQEFGIPINHVVEVDFEGFKDIIDTAGGTELCFWYVTRDKNTGLDAQPGCHIADGVEALQYARSRHFEEFRDGSWREDPTSDLGRIKRQQDFIDRTATAVIERVQSDPFVASELIDAASRAVRMDPGLDPVKAAGTLRKAFATGVNKYTLPVTGVTEDGNAVLVLDAGAEPILDYFRGVGPPPPVVED